MKPEIKEKWIIALKSGNYIRGADNLKRVYYGEEIKHCCLGVLCEIHMNETGEGQWRLDTSTGASAYANLTDFGECSRTHLTTQLIEWSGIKDMKASFLSDDQDRSLPPQAFSLTYVNDRSELDDFSEVIPYIEKYF